MVSWVRRRGDIYSTDFTVRQGTPGKGSSRLLASKGQELISDQPTRADGEESSRIFKYLPPTVLLGHFKEKKLPYGLSPSDSPAFFSPERS